MDDPPSSLRHRRGSSNPPDIMNDPAYQTNYPGNSKSVEDVDTCRICRGEATEEEPLFYPCKCSGSIKFVHQDCLMEWLSHSQKKYCELCKTPFRFTKLYHPQMPNALPTTIFVHRALIHVFKYFLAWCRAVLVGVVWLFVLPYCMRFVWRGLFWIGDGGWTRAMRASASPNPSGGENLTVEVEHLISSIKSALDPNATPSPDLSPSVKTFSEAVNRTTAEITAFNLVVKFLFDKTPLAGIYSRSTTSIATNATSNGTLSQAQPTLLSEIQFFRSMSNSPELNRFIVDILEGQVITLVVVVAFILIFLIREWVVQQQPVINLAALNAPDGRQQVQQQQQIIGDGRIDRIDENVIVAQPNIEPALNINLDANLRNQGLDNPFIDDTHDDELNDPHDDDPPEPSNFNNLHVHHDNDEEDIDHDGEGGPQPGDSMYRKALNITESLPTNLKNALNNRSLAEASEIINNMPPEETARLKEQMVALTTEFRSSQWGRYGTNDGNQLHSHSSNEPLATEHDDTGASSDMQNEQVFTAVEDDTDNIDIGESADPSSSSSTRPSLSTEIRRPIMPTRDRSFLATEIRRGLEESAHTSPSSNNAPQASTKELESEHSSEISSDSWQRISIPDNDDIQSGITSSNPHPVDKGKGRMSDIIPETIDSDDNESGWEEQNNVIRGEDIEEVGSSSADSDAQHERAISEPEVDRTSSKSSGSDLDQPPAANINTINRPNPRLPVAKNGVTHLVDWFWGDIATVNPETADVGPDDEQVIEDVAAEPPFVPFDEAQPINRPRQVDVDGQDAEVAAAAAEAGIDLNDPDAIEDAEDLEGILELIGMQGPITALFQNALFSALLISSTLAVAVWVPYTWGKVVLLFLGKPTSLFLGPLRLLSAVADLLIDVSLFIGCCCVYWLAYMLRMLVGPFAISVSGVSLQNKLAQISSGSMSVAINAARRFTDYFEIGAEVLDTAALWRVSVHSLAALRQIEGQLNATSQYITDTLASSYHSVTSITSIGQLVQNVRQFPPAVSSGAAATLHKMQEVASLAWRNKAYTLTLNTSESNIVIDPALEYWNSTDRSIAILAGYASIAILGAIYLKRRTTGPQNEWRLEGVVVEILQQAGGVLKVILIISIEMLAFPLYCGLLLDVALLPLYGDTIWSRYEFTLRSPWTSGFVHWFIGTCYMFHFALFVSMCRKIIRSGVLYFIRDPDDPTFHPVRDVLERNVTTQLRKIAFSALVYGGLVIVCLGGVVWGLDFAFQGIFPIYWSSHAPNLEFPLDLLFFNVLTPFAIKLIKPSDLLHTTYQWWFRCCARALRLTDFLFGEKQQDEVGRHVRKTWASWFLRQKGNVEEPVIGEDRRLLADDRGTEVYFIFDGRYVRAPASDQVRIPKGQAVFVNVDQTNHRLDGKPENSGIHARNSEMTTVVYIPPFFRLRITAFVFFIWLFAATTGVSVTVGPLLIGRSFFSALTGSKPNDIYAFTLALYFLGGIAYGVFRFRTTFANMIANPQTYLSTFSHLVLTIRNRFLEGLRLSYVYTFLILLFPLLVASLLELYILLPLHAYIDPRDTRIIHLIQDWTLGFLYAHIAYRILFSDAQSRPSRALQAVMRDGYMNPDIRLATRYFILPTFILFFFAAAGPAILAAGINSLYFPNGDIDNSVVRRRVYRFMYPALLALGVGSWAATKTEKAVKKWRALIRDEVYLVGERLHNFGEVKRAVVK